ncbi:MAG: PadR family transcriptional regulator [Flammeovirgaceae bacterium]|nr:PadR family transcriptional regulator [Flammeovirgaceae bacterium]MBE61842.1 PadR family transcriptional regulator [Flammeovirgaceae bacterium]MBR08597.1 PadR family transcriptional regulator [Rickettsiales bacterium]HCX24491.1 PadR family transcriptional regulator [Cytophagales bacterium]|tara:strand:+ start:3354 stop:3677 length:324 start_codon:yes stop_codon:yes gene_type:complete
MDKPLGQLEETILLVIASQENEGYAVSIQEYLTEKGRGINISAIHKTLYRLEDKGLVKSYLGGASNKRGGKSKRLFQVTTAGFNELKAIKDFRNEIWTAIPQLNQQS